MATKPRIGGFVAPLPWFSVPGRGLFIISIQPHEGYDFQKIGVIEDNRISFTHGGDKYEWVSSLPMINQRRQMEYLGTARPKLRAEQADSGRIQTVSKGNCCLFGAFSKVYQLSRAKE